MYTFMSGKQQTCAFMAWSYQYVLGRMSGVQQSAVLCMLRVLMISIEVVIMA